MQLGIFAKTFAGNEPATVLSAAREAGFACVQYNMACSGLPSLPDDIAPSVALAVRLAAEKTGAAIAAVSATANLIHPDPEERARGIARVKGIISAAPLMGTRIVTLCTGTRDAQDPWKYHADNHSIDAWRDLHLALDALLPVAEQSSIVLGIEPEHGNVIANAERAKTLLAERNTPTLGIILDPANLFAGHEAMDWPNVTERAIGSLAGQLVLAHAKDIDGAGRPVTAGQGMVDFRHVIERLTSAGYSGPLITHGLEASDAPHAARHLRIIAAQAGAPLS
jgi:sugar phosphate isomerase/epimerase